MAGRVVIGAIVSCRVGALKAIVITPGKTVQAMTLRIMVTGGGE